MRNSCMLQNMKTASVWKTDDNCQIFRWARKLKGCLLNQLLPSVGVSLHWRPSKRYWTVVVSITMNRRSSNSFVTLNFQWPHCISKGEVNKMLDCLMSGLRWNSCVCNNGGYAVPVLLGITYSSLALASTLVSTPHSSARLPTALEQPSFPSLRWTLTEIKATSTVVELKTRFCSGL